ncbi:Iron/zinc purple acid phosphatase-like protein [Fibrisoma limi BUZ 3]|uniref:Iron/zinc purple acid phosphatase-like protein n=1 Tax=Fibrisoma limi BUZ 3 TaxID=1185876 RepID=I2GN31_9BACT|nr:metallophosphoesterase family protein [Fibrisoma limi]CCH55309.1 Iron/zinc purple acid phosphatase-like protein [Fibrisoma limi BUZ 3]
MTMPFQRWFYLLASVVTVQSSKAQAVDIIRGPYLQVVTPTSITIRWRTSQPTESRVQFGTSATKLNQEVSDSKPVTDHEVVLTNLKPATRYYYTYGATKSTMKADPGQYFQTAPKPGSTEPVRIWALGDFGNSSATQLGARDAIVRTTQDRRPDVWLWLGDNAYSNGKEEEFQQHVFGVYQDGFFRNMPFWATPGNHDYGGQIESQDIPYFRICSMPKRGEAGGIPSGSESYYAFDYGNVHFVSLDSYGKMDGGQRLYDTTSRQVDWLKRDLAANKQPWTIVFFHHPPYTKGSHDSDTEELLVKLRQNLLPILERYNVDLVLGGHSHVYERTHPIVGHYGLADTFDPKYIVAASNSAQPNEYRVNGKKQGIIYVVAGSGGQLGGQEPGWPLKAAAYTNNTDGGSMLIDVNDNRLEARWVCTDGVVRDQFSIVKEKPGLR